MDHVDPMPAIAAVLSQTPVEAQKSMIPALSMVEALLVLGVGLTSFGIAFYLQRDRLKEQAIPA